jgi:hypothetical protein
VNDPGLPAPLARFAELLDDGRYWDSHEALEDAWLETGSGFYHGLILYASAFVHARRGTRHGIRAQLEKAREALDPHRPAYLGVDVEGVLDHADRCLRIVEANPDAADQDWEELIPRPRLAPDPRRVRGDEPELEG